MREWDCCGGGETMKVKRKVEEKYGVISFKEKSAGMGRGKMLTNTREREWFTNVEGKSVE